MAFILQRTLSHYFQDTCLQILLSGNRNIFSKQYSCLLSKHCHFGERISKNGLGILTQEKNLFRKRYLHQKQTHSVREQQKLWNRTALYYSSAFTILVAGFTYASVLLYRMYCQATGKGGQAIVDADSERVTSMKPVKERYITVNFSADINSSLMWSFKPQHPNIKVHPGETALAFYTAKNPTDKAITGIATYNVLPFEAGKYFNKIQCFCFEEQQLNPNEEVDMPVFFYLDPEFANDPWLENVNDIVLCYTFFEAKKDLALPRPSFF